MDSFIPLQIPQLTYLATSQMNKENKKNVINEPIHIKPKINQDISNLQALHYIDDCFVYLNKVSKRRSQSSCSHLQKRIRT